MNAKHYDALKTIGIFNDSFPPIMDGVALTTQNYGYWLHKRNLPVCIITPKIPNYTDNEPFPVYRYTSMPLIAWKPYRFGLPDIDLAFRNTIDKTPFGLVHAHCPFSSGYIAQHIAKEKKIPLVATFHTKYRDNFEQTIHNKMIVKLMVKEIVRFYEKADEVWIPQPAVEETLREYGFNGKVEVVENGNDFIISEPIEPIKKQAKIDLQLPESEIIFLFVGQHIWEKNIHLIVESLALIKDLPFKMYFVGTGYAADDIQQLVKKLDLDNKVNFVGVLTNREKLKQYYAAADVFLFPSTYDTWALAVREAAALHVPSVMIKGSTAAEIITDNYNGFLTENTPESFSAKLRDIISKPEILRKMGLNVSKTITRSWENVTEEVLDRYLALVKRNHKH